MHKQDNNELSVREMQPEDIPQVLDYWFGAAPDYLVSMGVDLEKMPTREELDNMLQEQVALPNLEKSSYALIWLHQGQPVGHCNVNQLQFGQQAHMHLHLWRADLRNQGCGTELVGHSLPYFFDELELQTLYCEPYALNPAPHKTLQRVGFSFVKAYETIPGAMNFKQPVKQWKMTVRSFMRLNDAMKTMTFESFDG